MSEVTVEQALLWGAVALNLLAGVLNGLYMVRAIRMGREAQQLREETLRRLDDIQSLQDEMEALVVTLKARR
jgi:hypothetical protein